MVDAPSPEKLARTVRWVVLIFIAYVFFTNLFGAPKKQPVTTASSEQITAKEKGCDKANPLTDLSVFAIPLLPTISPALHMHDEKEGEGVPAQCGQQATLRYSYTTVDGKVIFSDFDPKDKPEKITIGANELLPGAERGILGIKNGGVRILALSPQLAFAGFKDFHSLRNNTQFNLPKSQDIRRESILAKLSVTSLTPIPPTSPMPLRIIDSRFGDGSEIHCGDTVHANITMWKLDGTKLFSSIDSGKSINFAVGHSEVPFGIEQAVIGMKIGGARMLIMPPAYTRRLEETSSQNVPISSTLFPPNEIVLIEIELVPTLEEAPPATKK